MAFTGGAEKKVRLFDLEACDAEPQVLEGHTKTISNVVALPHSPHLIVSSGDDPNLRVWDTRECRQVKELPTPDAVASMEVNRELGTLTVATGKDVQFWDVNRYVSFSSELRRLCVC